MSVFDAESGLNVQAATCVHLDGTQALQVVRARHLQYDARARPARTPRTGPRRTRAIWPASAGTTSSSGCWPPRWPSRDSANPITDLDLINSVKADLTFDQSWSVNDMANLVLDFHSVNINSVPQLTLPVPVVTDPEGPVGA